LRHPDGVYNLVRRIDRDLAASPTVAKDIEKIPEILLSKIERRA
jgi:hypothetical protein